MKESRSTPSVLRDRSRDTSIRNTHPKPTKRQLLNAAFNIATCMFVTILVFSQQMTVVIDSYDTRISYHLGEDARTGPHLIAGFNDVPYTDRSFVCTQHQCSYRAVQVNEALCDHRSLVIDGNGTSKAGYRMINRKEIAFTKQSQANYDNTCTVINQTLNAILDSCEALGYSSLGRNGVKIIDGLTSTELTHIPHVLPVIGMPFTDHDDGARFVIPGDDGYACVFRLAGKYLVSTEIPTIFQGVNKTIRENRTEELLGRHGGIWKNGWYEDLQGMRWYSDIVSTNPNTTYGTFRRQFDTTSNKEVDSFSGDEAWLLRKVIRQWGFNTKTLYNITHSDDILIANGLRYGIFNVNQRIAMCVLSQYEITTLISNFSVLWILWRWGAMMLALYRGYYKGYTRWHTARIGCLSCCRSLHILPLTMMLRARTTLACFWTVGCHFGENQGALANSWFIMYPAIVDFAFLMYSLLNLAGKLVRRRMTDALFVPTIVFLSLWHFYRIEIAASDAFGIDSRANPVVSSEEIMNMTSLDMLNPVTSLRINGNVTAFYAVKVAVVLINVLALVFGKNIAKNEQLNAIRFTKTEKALALRVHNNGGLGCSSLYDTCIHRANVGRTIYMINAYEVGRLNYVIYGDSYLIDWEDWIIVTSLKPMQMVQKLWNHRIKVFSVIKKGGVYVISDYPEMWHIDDPRIQCIPWWMIDLRPLG